MIFLKRLCILHTNKNTKGFDYMKKHKEINNLPTGDELIKLEITESVFLIHHLANFMDDTKKNKI